MNTNLIIFCVLLLIVGVLIAVYQKGRRAIIRDKKAAYDIALKSKNREQALKAGREYYAALRSGELTAQDELAINNDLSLI